MCHLSKHALLYLFRVRGAEGHLNGHVGCGPFGREETVEDDLGGSAEFSFLRAAKGIERGAEAVLRHPDARDRMTACAERMNDLVLIVDIGLVIHHEHHVKPRAELTAEDELADLCSDVGVDRLHTHDDEMVRRLRKHVDAGNRESLVSQHPFHFKCHRERAEQLSFIRGHAHVGDCHDRFFPHSDRVDTIDRSFVARACS